MFRISFFVFWATTILYLVTLFTVSYVGVYLTYIAIPIIVISGLIMKLSKPNKKSQEVIDTSKEVIHQITKATTHVVSKSSVLLNQLSNSIERGSEAFATKICEFNVEQKSREPFIKVKIKAEEVKHISELSINIVPGSYIFMHQTIRIIIEMMNITINLMNATIDHPEQRNSMCLLLDDVKINFESELEPLLISRDRAMQEMYELGLTHNASAGDKIRFILAQYPDGEIEKTASEYFPKAKQSLQNLQIARTTLQEKGFVTY